MVSPMCMPYFKILKFSQSFRGGKQRSQNLHPTFTIGSDVQRGKVLLIQSFHKDRSNLRFDRSLRDLTGNFNEIGYTKKNCTSPSRGFQVQLVCKCMRGSISTYHMLKALSHILGQKMLSQPSTISIYTKIELVCTHIR